MAALEENMKVRIWNQTAVMLLTFIVVFFGCTGCREKTEEDLQPLTLEENLKEDGTEEADAAEQGQRSQWAESEISAGEPNPTIFVYVCGAVNAPGVYELDADARVYEAIACAGGVREDAAEESVNQAQTLTDGERLYVPTDAEAEQGLADPVQTEPGQGAADGKVNINTASKEELTTLNGIGESRAESIIGYRETHGGFQSIEELMNVEGIKEGVFSKIKDRITVS